MLGLCAIKQSKRLLRPILLFLNQILHLFHIVYLILAKKGEFYELFSEEQKDFIDQIEPLNIEARYPSAKERLLKSLTDSKCLEIIDKTKQKQKWIKQKL